MIAKYRPLLALCCLLAPLAAHADQRVRLDKASVAELDAIDGISTDMAQAIATLREQRGGRLGSVEELRVIPGIDDATLDVLRERCELPIQGPLAGAGSFSSADDVLKQFDSEPDITRVQTWANEYAHTSPELVDRWLRQSRLFGALPEVQLKYELHDAWDLGYIYLPADGVIDSNDEALNHAIDKGADGQDGYYWAQATWHLDELVMSTERIRVISETQDVVKLRDKILSSVTSIYFERRRLQVEMLLAPKADVRGQVVDQLRLQELTANLDALTGGVFSASLPH